MKVRYNCSSQSGKNKRVLDFAKRCFGPEIEKRMEYLLTSFPDAPNVFSIYFDIFKPILDKSKKVLDAGCGRGEYTWFIKAKEVVGVDAKKKELEIARIRAPRKISYIYADLDNIPFPRDSYDTILCYMVMEHLQYPQKTIKEFSRILSSSGNLLILTPNIYNPFYFINKHFPQVLLHFLKQRLKIMENETDLYYQANTYSTLHKLLQDEGFSAIKWYYCLDTPITTRTSLYLFFWKLINSLSRLPFFSWLSPQIAVVARRKARKNG